MSILSVPLQLTIILRFLGMENCKKQAVGYEYEQSIHAIYIFMKILHMAMWNNVIWIDKNCLYILERLA